MRRLPIALGIFAAAVPAVWVGVLWAVSVERIPEFIMAGIERPAKQIALLLFGSREAVVGIWYPLFLVYCSILGVLVWFACRCIVRRRINVYTALEK